MVRFKGVVPLLAHSLCSIIYKKDHLSALDIRSLNVIINSLIRTIIYINMLISRISVPDVFISVR